MSPLLTREPSDDVESSDVVGRDVVGRDVVDRAIAPPAVPRLTLKKILYHPLTGLAIAAHLLLLVVPFHQPQASAPEAKSVEAAVDDAIPVDILNLSALSEPKPPEPSVAEPPPAEAPTAPTAAVPESLPADPVPIEPVPEQSPAEQPPVEQPPAEEQSPVEQPPVEKQPPAYVAQADQQAFISEGVAALGEGTSGIGNFRSIGLPAENYFEKGNAANFLDYGTNPPGLVAGSIDAVWMDKQADRVAEQIEATYGPNGVQLVPLSSYGDELLYEMLTPTNDTMMYVSLVNFPSKGSSLMVTWSVNPLGS